MISCGFDKSAFKALKEPAIKTFSAFWLSNSWLLSVLRHHRKSVLVPSVGITSEWYFAMVPKSSKIRARTNPGTLVAASVNSFEKLCGSLMRRIPQWRVVIRFVNRLYVQVTGIKLTVRVK